MTPTLYTGRGARWARAYVQSVVTALGYARNTHRPGTLTADMGTSRLMDAARYITWARSENGRAL